MKDVLIIFNAKPLGNYIGTMSMNEDLYKKLSAAHDYELEGPIEEWTPEVDAVMAIYAGFAQEGSAQRELHSELEREMIGKITHINGLGPIAVSNLDYIIACRITSRNAFLMQHNKTEI